MSENREASATKYRVKTIGSGQSTYLDAAQLDMAILTAIQRGMQDTSNHPTVLIQTVEQVDEGVFQEIQIALVDRGVFQVNLTDHNARAAFETLLEMALAGRIAEAGQSTLPFAAPTVEEVGDDVQSQS